ncbi:MAG: ribonuclease P protein component [Candidatus Competibacteraceae bacterium]|nr:ribonuclease P protein component [Candidatus Competibacteraceae bacterium]
MSRKVEFQRVFDQPIRSGDRCFTVLARLNQLGYPRLGLAISRKAAKSAVARNRIKRIVRESFRHHQTELNGFDVVVMGRPQMAGHENAALFTSLQHHWARLVSWAKS